MEPAQSGPKSPDRRAERSEIRPRGGPLGGRTDRRGEGSGTAQSAIGREAVPAPPRPRADGMSVPARRRCLRRFCGETVEVHAEPTIGPKHGPCGANDRMSRKRGLKGPPSLVKGHSPDEFVCPDVLPFFFYFVGRAVGPSTTSARFSGRAHVPARIYARLDGRVVTLGSTIDHTACAVLDTVVWVILRAVPAPRCLCRCHLCDQHRCPCSWLASAVAIGAMSLVPMVPALPRSRCASGSVICWRLRLSLDAATDARLWTVVCCRCIGLQWWVNVGTWAHGTRSSSLLTIA